MLVKIVKIIRKMWKYIMAIKMGLFWPSKVCIIRERHGQVVICMGKNKKIMILSILEQC
jgi:hypothetical protein